MLHSRSHYFSYFFTAFLGPFHVALYTPSPLALSTAKQPFVCGPPILLIHLPPRDVHFGCLHLSAATVVLSGRCHTCPTRACARASLVHRHLSLLAHPLCQSQVRILEIVPQNGNSSFCCHGRPPQHLVIF